MVDPQVAFSLTFSTLAAADAQAVKLVASTPLAPAIVVALCVVAGLATWLLLPGKREAAIRSIGGVILLATGLVFAAILIRWTVAWGGMSVYFWGFSAIALFASVKVITHTKPVYSALYFVLTVFATAGLFVLMWAEFMAAALVLIYAGAILITYVFVIMLASEATTGAVGAKAESLMTEHDAISRSPLMAAFTGFAIAGLLIFLILDKGAQIPEPASRTQATDLGSAQELGKNLLEENAINVQLAAVILTLAMVGAITLARRRVIVSPHDRSIKTVVTPAVPVEDNPHSIPVYGTSNPRHKAYPET